MKAIILLQEFRKIKVGNDFVGYQELKEEVQSKIDEAIKELKELENIKNTVIEEIEYAIANPEYANVYLNNAIRFLRNK